MSKENIYSGPTNIKIKTVDKPINKLVSFSIDFSALDSINNIKLPKFEKMSKIKIKDYLNDKMNTSPLQEKAINGFREYRYMKDTETRDAQSKSYNNSALKNRHKMPSRVRTKPLIEFNPCEHDYHKVFMDTVLSPQRLIFKCKSCDKQNANNVNYYYSCRQHLNCNSNLCKRCYDAIFILNSRYDDNSMSARDLMSLNSNGGASTSANATNLGFNMIGSGNIHVNLGNGNGHNNHNNGNGNGNHKTDKVFYDRDEEIKRLKLKVKTLEKHNKEYQQTVETLQNKLDKFNEDKLSKFNKDLLDTFYKFKQSHLQNKAEKCN